MFVKKLFSFNKGDIIPAENIDNVYTLNIKADKVRVYKVFGWTVSIARISKEPANG